MHAIPFEPATELAATIRAGLAAHVATENVIRPAVLVMATGAAERILVASLADALRLCVADGLGRRGVDARQDVAVATIRTRAGQLVGQVLANRHGDLRAVNLEPRP